MNNYRNSQNKLMNEEILKKFSLDCLILFENLILLVIQENKSNRKKIIKLDSKNMSLYY